MHTVIVTLVKDYSQDAAEVAWENYVQRLQEAAAAHPMLSQPVPGSFGAEAPACSLWEWLWRDCQYSCTAPEGVQLQTMVNQLARQTGLAVAVRLGPDPRPAEYAAWLGTINHIGWERWGIFDAAETMLTQAEREAAFACGADPEEVASLILEKLCG